jgi:hypothetical protein
MLKKTLMVLAVAAVAAAASTYAYASIPDGSGAIHGCYKTGKGDLRVIDPSAGDACLSSETPLTWSQTGPQGVPGPQGQQGAQGPQGVQGPPGPAVGGHVYVSNENSHEMLQEDNTEIVGLSGLPAGNYLIWSPMEIVGDDRTLNSVCDWYLNGASFPIQGANNTTFTYDANDDKFGTAPMFGEVTLTGSNNTLVTKCATDSDNHPIASGQMIALQVGDVN